MFEIPGLGDKLGVLGQLGQLKNMWEDFKKNNPDVIDFMNKVNEKGYCEGQEFVIAVKYPDGTEQKADFVLGKDDVAVLETLAKIRL